VTGPSVQFSELPALTEPLTAADRFPVDDVANGVTSRATLADVGDFVEGRAGVFNVVAHGAVGDGVTNDTAALQAALDAATTAGGGNVVIPPGRYRSTASLTAGADVCVVLMTGATLVHEVYDETALFLGARGSLVGGGIIESPEVWDGTNAEATYAVVYTTADDVTVAGVTLKNVPRCGILFKNASRGIVRGVRIFGNYPEAQYTGTETGHIGISVDPGGGTDDGQVTMSGNLIQTCVQGAFVGNYGTGAGRGIAFTGNVVRGCWDHGIYCATGDGYAITGNTFDSCRIPVVVTGTAHLIADNTMYTTGTGDANHVTGISVRDGEGCTITGNTLVGDAPSAGTIIDVREFNGTTLVNNLVAHNTIVVAGGTSVGIRIGLGNATTCYGNIVQGNVVRSVGRQFQGLISLFGNSGTHAFGNAILDNRITILGDAYGIYVSAADDTQVRGNYVRLEFSAASPTTLAGVFLTTAATRTNVQNNTFVVPATFGDDITFRAINENAAVSVADSAYRDNTFSFDLTLLTAGVTHLIQTSSGAYLDERGTGAPAFPVIAGSCWHRTDGGAATSLYVKETASSSTTWVGK
jgi:hypothetical protein